MRTCYDRTLHITIIIIVMRCFEFLTMEFVLKFIFRIHATICDDEYLLKFRMILWLLTLDNWYTTIPQLLILARYPIERQEFNWLILHLDAKPRTQFKYLCRINLRYTSHISSLLIGDNAKSTNAKFKRNSIC